MSYEDADEIKEKLHNAYMRVCEIDGEHTTFKLVRVVAFESGSKKYSVQIDEVQ